MAVSMIGPKFYAWNRDGKPLAFGKLYTYQARTNTPKATYQSEGQVVENTNPVILNGEGYANVYLDGSYKMVLKDDKDNEIWSSDPVTSASAEEWVNCLSATYVSPTQLRVAGNFVDVYDKERRVRINNNTSNYAYSTIVDSTFSAGFTTITIDDSVVATGIINVCASIIGSESAPLSGRNIGDYTELAFVTLESLKSLTTVGGNVVDRGQLTDGSGAKITTTGRAGDFYWNSSDLSGKVAFDTQEGIYIALDGEDGSNGAWVRSYGQNAVSENGGATVKTSWFGASPSENDNAPFFQAAIDTGAVSVFVPDLGDGYIVRTSFKQLKNTRFYGELRGIESQYVSGSDDPNQGQRGTVLLMRDDAQIQHDAGCEIDHLCFRYDEQNYEILTGGGDPDGLTNFTVYPPTIKYVGDSDGSVNVHHILALGAYILYESPAGLNIEKPTFEHIRGWVLRYGFDIEKCADMAKFYDIHFNPKVMFQLPEYNRNPGTNHTNDKYTHYVQMFRFGRVDGGYIDNCFIYACQTFCRIKQVTGVSGGSIRVSNSAADICNTMLSIDQTQRGFGFAIENCWITPAINKIVKDDGVFATVKSGWVRITDDGTNKPENVHVELSDCKTSAGGVTVGFTNSAAYEEQFHFSANASSTNNSMIITNCHFDEISGWDNADPVSSLVTGVTDNLNHICSFDHCFGRFALTDVYTKFSDDKKSAGTSYSREISKHRTFMAGSHLTADFAFEGREFGDPNRYAAEWMLKNASGNILIEQLLKGSNIYRYLNAANGHTVFPLGVFNEGHLVLGSEASGIHIFRNGNDLRISAGPPASSTDGTLLGTAT